MNRSAPPAAVTAHLPLKTQWFHILLALSGEPSHGSGIVRAVLEQTDGRTRLWPATLYGALEEMAAGGWIEELVGEDERPEGESEKKRFYRLTPQGAGLLEAEAKRLQRLATSALDQLATARP